MKLACRLAIVPVVLAATVSSVHAALPAGVETAITTAGADMVLAITAVITAFIAFWGLRKLASKLGWS